MILDARTLAYLTNVHQFVVVEGRVDIPLMASCPECGEAAEDIKFEYDHIVIETTADTYAIVIACEGYWAINPNLVGVPNDNWSDGTGAIVEALPDNCPGVPHRGHTNVDLDCPLH